MGLEFANLARAWWALLAVPIIVLFILKIRLRRRQVATLLFWDQLMQEHPPRAWWRRLRNLLALLLQLAFLALLVGALTEPLWSWQKRDARRIVYVIDNSASLSARDDGETETRLEKIQAALKTMAATLRQEDTAAIVTAGGLPQVLVGTTGDVKRLAEAIENVPPTDSPDQLAQAVELARRLVGEDGKQEIVVLTDGAGDKAFEDQADVTVYGFGADTANTGITSFQVRRNIADVTSYQVMVEVTHFGNEAIECRLDLELEGNIVDVVPLTLKPNVPWKQTLDHISPNGGRLTARLDVDDALATDNHALAVLPKQDPIPVLLVTPGSLFLRSVFASIPNVQLTIAETLPAEIPAEAVVVVHKTKLERVPPSGSLIVIDPVSDSDLWTLGESVSEPIIARQADSPLLAHIRLENVIFPGAKELKFSQKAVPLLESPTDTSLYTQLPRPTGDVLVLAVNLEDGDLPLRIAFPVMIKNAMESFLGGKGELRPAMATGEATSIPNRGHRKDITDLAANTGEDSSSSPSTLAENDEALLLRSPRGRLEHLTSASEHASLGPFDEVGLWWAGPEGRLESAEPTFEEEDFVPIAVNLANANESDLRPKAELPQAPALSAVWGGHSLWFYLTLGATLGICLEWFLYQRRIVA
jgi:hypothetical protein